MMELPKLHLACSDDELRPLMNCIEIKEGIATATDAHMLVRADLTKSTLWANCKQQVEGKFIHRTTWEKMIYCDYRALDNGIFISEAEGFETFHPFVQEGGKTVLEKFPNYQPLIKFESVNISGIRITASKLARLAEIFEVDENQNDGQLQLEFQESMKAILVFNSAYKGIYGFLMPCLPYTDKPDLTFKNQD